MGKWKWSTKDDVRFVKRVKKSMRHDELPDMSDKQVGILLGHFRKNGKPVSRLTVRRAAKQKSRRPARKKPGPKSEFEWCKPYLRKLLHRWLNDPNRADPVTSKALQDAVRLCAAKRRRAARQNGDPVVPMPVPEERTIRKYYNEWDYFGIEPKDFRELSAANKKERVKFCHKVVHTSFYKKTNIFLWTTKIGT